MNFRFKLRRGPAAEWTTDNPVLFAGEPGYETDTNKLKIGDGVQLWNDLHYFPNPSDLVAGVASVDGLTGAVVLTTVYAAHTHVHAQSDVTGLVAALAAKADSSALSTHIADVANPHSVTKAQVGLTNVDNTSDASKPVSTAQQTALDLKASESDLIAHVSDLVNPHSVTKAQVGLSNVDNTTDTAKPISTAQQTALDLKAPLASPALTGTATAVNVTVSGRLRMDYDTLTDAGTIAIDASTGNRFDVTLAANAHVLGNPTNAVNGQQLFFKIKEDGTGGWAMTLGSKFNDPNGYFTGMVTTAGARSYLGVVYDSTDDQFDVLAFASGF